MHFYTPLLLLLQPSVQWLSIVNVNNDAKPPPKWILRELDVSRSRPLSGGLPHLETFTWQNLTPAESVTRSGRPGYPPWRHLPCKRDHIKMRYYMDRRVTPRKRVTSPTWHGFPYLHVNRPCSRSNLSIDNFRWRLTACLHGGGGPQVGEVTGLGGVTRQSIYSLILIWSRLPDRWGDPLRRIALSAGGKFCHVNVSRWGDPPSRRRIRDTSNSLWWWLCIITKGNNRKPRH